MTLQEIGRMIEEALDKEDDAEFMGVLTYISPADWLKVAQKIQEGGNGEVKG